MKPRDLGTRPAGRRPDAASALESILAPVRPEMEATERHIRSWAASPNPLIAEVGGYLFQDKGKRLRPAVLLLSARVAGYRGDEAPFPAALIEVIHTASLIHDDIIDNSALRRGKESVHAKWGPNITVLLGDFLFIKSIGLSLRLGNGRIIEILAGLSARMIEGELIEYSHSRNPWITQSQYLEVADMKTASLFAAAAQIGAVLGGLDPDSEEKLKAVGMNLGLAFQIIDDVLDFVGREEALGKPVLSDLAEGRITLPLIHALEKDPGNGTGRLSEIVRRKDIDDSVRKEVLDLLESRGSLDYAYAKAEEYAGEARTLLARFPAGPERDALENISRFILDRES